jgi:hypothetical protein
MEITIFDKWKFRRCIETLTRYGCFVTCDNWGNKCKKCSFNIQDNKWLYLHEEMMRLE